MMKILYICNEYPPAPHGGIGVFTRNIATELSGLGYECYVIGTYPVAVKLIEEIQGVTVIRIPEISINWLQKHKLGRIILEFANKIKLSFTVIQMEKKLPFDLIECFEWSGPILIKPKTKMLVRLHGSNTAHSNFEQKKPSLLIRFYERRTIKIADYLVGVSFHMLKIIENTFNVKSIPRQVIYNTFNEDCFKLNLNIKRNTKQLLFVGKYQDKKGVVELFNVFNELVKYDAAYRLNFVGPHTESNANYLLKILDDEHKDKVVFIQHASQSKLAEIYHESLMLIMPSKAEAFGLTAIEAMACGCIVAMNNIPISHEIIESEIEGLILICMTFRNVRIRFIGF